MLIAIYYLQGPIWSRMLHVRQYIIIKVHRDLLLKVIGEPSKQ